jgi:hypothetical protein
MCIHPTSSAESAGWNFRRIELNETNANQLAAEQRSMLGPQQDEKELAPLFLKVKVTTHHTTPHHIRRPHSSHHHRRPLLFYTRPHSIHVDSPEVHANCCRLHPSIVGKALNRGSRGAFAQPRPPDCQHVTTKFKTIDFFVKFEIIQFYFESEHF